jgi:acyl carrier protein
MSDPTTGSATTTGTAPSDAELRAAVLEGLARIAPEIDPTTLRGDVSLREQADLDSMDFLNFVIGLSESLGVDVPEADYPKLATLDGCVAYLAGHGARCR